MNADGKGGFFQTTRIALVCASIMGVLKYSGRGKPIWAEGLALSQDPRLLAAFKAYTTPTNGSPGLTPFATLILMVGVRRRFLQTPTCTGLSHSFADLLLYSVHHKNKQELIDEFQIGERASEYAVRRGR